jgi:hypothetical protein
MGIKKRQESQTTRQAYFPDALTISTLELMASVGMKSSIYLKRQRLNKQSSIVHLSSRLPIDLTSPSWKKGSMMQHTHRLWTMKSYRSSASLVMNTAGRCSPKQNQGWIFFPFLQMDFDPALQSVLIPSVLRCPPTVLSSSRKSRCRVLKDP